jgi:hypothetical protein
MRRLLIFMFCVSKTVIQHSIQSLVQLGQKSKQNSIQPIKKEGIPMAEFYVWRIINGRTTYANVPTSLKAEVAQILTEEGFASLIIE